MGLDTTYFRQELGDALQSELSQEFIYPLFVSRGIAVDHMDFAIEGDAVVQAQAPLLGLPVGFPLLIVHYTGLSPEGRAPVHRAHRHPRRPLHLRVLPPARSCTGWPRPLRPARRRSRVRARGPVPRLARRSPAGSAAASTAFSGAKASAVAAVSDAILVPPTHAPGDTLARRRIRWTSASSTSTTGSPMAA